jgi:glycerophosphoryl diester phosphodiesterase
MAFDAGADGIELDVRLAKDGVPVVIHDADLERTGRKPGLVSELTSAELLKVDVGTWFNKKFPKRAKAEFKNESIPSLAQVLELCNNTEGLIYLELKPNRTDSRKLAEAVCDLIRDSKLLPRIIIKSFKLGIIPIIRQLLPDVQTAALFEPIVMDYLRRRRHLLRLTREFGADQISLHHALVTRKLAKLAAEQGMPVTIWTVDDRKIFKKAKKLGIQAVITNDPAKMLSE